MIPSVSCCFCTSTADFFLQLFAQQVGRCVEKQRYLADLKPVFLVLADLPYPRLSRRVVVKVAHFGLSVGVDSPWDSYPCTARRDTPTAAHNSRSDMVDFSCIILPPFQRKTARCVQSSIFSPLSR